MAIKPAIPKGTRDFGPKEVHRRQFILNTIRETFEQYGFQPIETPAMENMSTLTGKYGEEGDKLLFRILNSGDYLSKADQQALADQDSNALATSIAEKGLRYDLTIPFARFVVQHQNDITFPFRRYQMQPVWRADRPQKGRYREFWQCDADVIGSDSLVSEVELVEIYLRVFEKLGIPVTVRLNNRKLLEGLAEVIGAKDRFGDITTALDKLDKIGWDGVSDDMANRGMNDQTIKQLRSIMEDAGNKLEEWKEAWKNSEKGTMGWSELNTVFELLTSEDTENTVFDPTLARGLDYYTGTILEVTAKKVDMGSIGGGGRYDNLTGVFGLEGISGVGISFGLDRIYDVLEEMDGFPEQATKGTEALFIRFEDAPLNKLMEMVRTARNHNVRSELYPDAVKLKKQFKYADQNNIPWVVTAGPEELANNQVGLKNMVTGEQQTLTLPEALAQIEKNREASK